VRGSTARSVFLRPNAEPASSQRLLFGHRGYSALAPENTMAAFSLLLEHRIPGVELDVRLSRDAEVLVIHDENARRVTGVDAAVEECPASMLRSLDAGGWFGASFRGESIPLLDEVFELLADRVYYDVELKWRGRRGGGLEEAVVERIRAHGLEDRCLVSSFNPYCIRRIQALAPQMPTAHIYSSHREVPLLLRRGQAGLFLPAPFMKPQSKQLTRLGSFILRRVLGRQIITWTVDEPAEAARLIELGVRGFVSNDPDLIKPVMSRPPASPDESRRL
jgi:glycerophosphoryl diester phosphodiesterase